jgi:chorismate-pyruvate lyase
MATVGATQMFVEFCVLCIVRLIVRLDRKSREQIYDCHPAGSRNLMKKLNGIFLTIVALMLPFTALADEWPGSFLARVEAMALIETLNAELLSNPSATLTLERWCGAHRLAAEPKISAHLLRGENQQIAPEDRQRLAITADEPVRYRRVQLFCGDKLLSEADNWYVPGRLTPEMNRLLDQTDTPFGRAVKDLEFQRQTLKATTLWRPLPEGWELEAAQQSGTGTLPVPEHLLEHRAILYTKARVPFSMVVETYTKHMFDFPLNAAK